MKNIPHFMKNWVDYMVRERLDWIAEHSFRNCHALGVDSIMFDNTPGSEIRLFIAHENHQLADNSPWSDDPQSKLSVAFHPHHCDITLHVVRGQISNVSPQKAPGTRLFPVKSNLSCFSYNSHIRDGKGGFERTSQGHDFMVRSSRYMEGESFFLPAKDLHSIAVDEGEVAAWFVYEGEEDSTYQNIAYSDANLSNWRPDGFYLPMTTDYVLHALAKVGL